MVIASFILGVVGLTLGIAVILGRERIVANHRRRFTDRYVQPPMMWLVLGTMFALAGLGEILVAVSDVAAPSLR